MTAQIIDWDIVKTSDIDDLCDVAIDEIIIRDSNGNLFTTTRQNQADYTCSCGADNSRGALCEHVILTITETARRCDAAAEWAKEQGRCGVCGSFSHGRGWRMTGKQTNPGCVNLSIYPRRDATFLRGAGSSK